MEQDIGLLLIGFVLGYWLGLWDRGQMDRNQDSVSQSDIDNLEDEWR